MKEGATRKTKQSFLHNTTAPCSWHCHQTPEMQLSSQLSLFYELCIAAGWGWGSELWQQRCECSRPARQWIFGVFEEDGLIFSPKIIPKKSSYTSSNHNSNNTWKLGGILDHAWPFKDNDAMLGFQPWQCILHLLFIALSQGASFPYKTSTTIYSRRLLYLLR